MWTVLRTLIIGGLGAAAAFYLSVPVPFLTGPVALVTLCALSGLAVTIPEQLRNIVFVVIGMNMGAAVTPEAVENAARWPGSLIMLALSITVIFLGGAWLMRRVFGLDLMSSLLTAVPGHLSFVISLSAETRADIPRVMMIQTMRVLTLTLAVPLLAPFLSDGPLPAMRPMAQVMTLPVLALLLALSVLVGLVFQRLRVPAALLLGGMAVSSLSHGSGLIDGGVPRWLSIPAFTIMGTLIGARFSGITFAMVARSFASSALLSVFSVLVSLAAALATARLFDLPVMMVLIAFAPGGLETMMAMSVLLNANPAYVAAHHVFRLFFLTFLIPIIVTRAKARL